MTNDKNMVDLRNIVLNMLMENYHGKLSHMVLKDTLDEYAFLDKQQRAFITRLFQGTIERAIEADYIINLYSKTPVNKMKPVIRYILRMAVYQLEYMENVPASAICNEAVKLTQKRKFTNLKGFVNGVTRNISRNIENIEYPTDTIEKMSIVYSMPEWIVRMWMRHYGQQKTENMLKSMYCEKRTTIRVNRSFAEVDEIVESLEKQNVSVQKSEIYENALIISNYDSIAALDAFRKGFVTVQDLSSMMAGVAAQAVAGDYVIDVCAAPGGKSLHIADMLNATGKVVARDLTDYKVELINENIKRSGFGNIIAEKYDATILDEKSVEKADVVMADLPCSGLGVMGNKTDIKYNTSMEQIEELSTLQKEILTNSAKYVKPGGTLIFSTCTVAEKENEDNVKWIEENLPFKLESLEGILPDQILSGSDKGYIQILPGEYGMDGFFISRFKKIQ